MNYNFGIFAQENRLLHQNTKRISKYLNKNRHLLSDLEVQMAKTNLIGRLERFGTSSYSTHLSHHKDMKNDILLQGKKLHQLSAGAPQS